MRGQAALEVVRAELTSVQNSISGNACLARETPVELILHAVACLLGAGGSGSPEQVFLEFFREKREFERKVALKLVGCANLHKQTLALDYALNAYGVCTDPQLLPAGMGHKVHSYRGSQRAEGSLCGVWDDDGAIVLDAWREGKKCFARMIVSTNATHPPSFLICTATSTTVEPPVALAAEVFGSTEPACLQGLLRTPLYWDSFPLYEWWEYLAAAPMLNCMLEGIPPRKLPEGFEPGHFSSQLPGQKVYVEWEYDALKRPRVVVVSRSFYGPPGEFNLLRFFRFESKDYMNRTDLMAYATRLDTLPTTVTITTRVPERGSMELIIGRKSPEDHPLADVVRKLASAAGGMEKRAVMKYVCERAGLHEEKVRGCGISARPKDAAFVGLSLPSPEEQTRAQPRMRAAQE